MGVWTVVILWTLYLVTGGAAVTSWTALCGSSPQDNGCKLVETECGLLASNITGTTQNLSITPVFTEFLPGNDRWYPRLNVSFEFSPVDSHFAIRIAYRGKHAIPIEYTCDQCFNLTIKGHAAKHTKSSREREVITLQSGEMRDCNKTLRPLFLYIRVKGMGYTECNAEGSISLPKEDNRTKGNTGSPTCYRRSVPDAGTNRPCCADWTTPLVVRNSSCHRAIVVEFLMAPKGCIHGFQGYQVGLERDGIQIRPPIFVNATGDVEYGTVTFTDVSLSNNKSYYVSLKILPASKVRRDVVSGYLSISNTVDCTMEHWGGSRHIPPGGIELHRLLLIVFSITITLLLVLTVTLAVILRRTAISKPFPRHEDEFKPEEPRPQRKRVLLVYCMDNNDHRKVVRKLADLLQREGFCDVILDQWQLKSILKEGIPSWVGKQYEKAEKVIVVGSEGVYNFIDAKREDHYWPALENAFPLSRVFPCAVKVLQDSVSVHTRSKALALTFAYTKEQPPSNRALRELTCNDIHYRFTRDIERLMLSIHDTSKYVCGNNIMKWGIDILKTESGQQLEMAISKAVQFHESNWFSETYGEAIPYPHKEPNKVNNLNAFCAKRDSIYYIKDAEELDLITPEVSSADPDLESSKAVFLIGPTDISIDDDPEVFIAPENVECDSNPDLSVQSSRPTHSIGSTAHTVSGKPDLIAPEDSETDSNPDVDYNAHLVEQYDRSEDDIGPAMFWTCNIRGVPPPIGGKAPDGSSSFTDHFDSGIGMTERSVALGSLRVRSVPLTSYCLEEDRHGCGKADECYVDYGDGHGLIQPPSSLSSPSSLSCSGSSSGSLPGDLPHDVLLPHIENPRLPV